MLKHSFRRSDHSLFVKSQQSSADLHRGTSTTTALQEMTDRRLAAWDQPCKLLLRETSSDQFGGDFLDVHNKIITYVFEFINTFVMSFFITIVI
jgi:hypothetical protein